MLDGCSASTMCLYYSKCSYILFWRSRKEKCRQGGAFLTLKSDDNPSQGSAKETG